MTLAGGTVGSNSIHRGRPSKVGRRSSRWQPAAVQLGSTAPQADARRSQALTPSTTTAITSMARMTVLASASWNRDRL